MTAPVFVTDSSAWIAIQRAEPGSGVLAQAVADAHAVLIAAPTKLECFIVALRARDALEARNVLTLIDGSGAQTISFDDEQLAAAMEAYRRFGRGNGAGGTLNFGDCFSYALAKTRGLPLLFRGDDFRATDIEPALP